MSEECTSKHLQEGVGCRDPRRKGRDVMECCIGRHSLMATAEHWMHIMANGVG